MAVYTHESTEKERRKYALLDAAAVLCVVLWTDEIDKNQLIQLSVGMAEGLLLEIERVEAMKGKNV